MKTRQNSPKKLLYRRRFGQSSIIKLSKTFKKLSKKLKTQKQAQNSQKNKVKPNSQKENNLNK